MIAHIDDFRLLLFLTILVIPLLLLFRTSKQGQAPPAEPRAAMEWRW